MWRQLVFVVLVALSYTDGTSPSSILFFRTIQKKTQGKQQKQNVLSTQQQKSTKTTATKATEEIGIKMISQRTRPPWTSMKRQSLEATTILSTSNKKNKKMLLSPTSEPSISLVSSSARPRRPRRQLSSSNKNKNQKDEEEEEEKEISSLEEMRSQLGIVGKTVAGAVEVGIVTAGSYLSGGILGYVLGTFTGLPVLFKSSTPTSSTSIANEAASKAKATATTRIVNRHGKEIQNGIFNEFQLRMKSWHLRSMNQASSWAQLSAAFSGFHAFIRVCRGNVEDRWNGILGSACTGAYMSRSAGPNAMVQGAITYASFTYILDRVFGSSGGGEKKKRFISDSGQKGDYDFDYDEVSVEDRGF